MKRINMFFILILSLFFIGLTSAEVCNFYENMSDCENENLSCFWEFNESNQYQCVEGKIIDYCSPFVLDFKGCINNVNLFGCYWDMDLESELPEVDCMPVDGNCSARDLEVCSDYVGCVVFNGDTCLSQNEMIKTCEDIGDNETCSFISDCVWDSEVEGGECILNCEREDGVDENSCSSAFGGGLCVWEPTSKECNTFGVNPMGEDDCFLCHQECEMDSDCHFECDQNVCLGEGMIFSECFKNDGNMTGCKADSECIWMPVQYCSEGDFCYDVDGSGIENGFCNPSIMNFGGDVNCIQYDGNKDGCSNAAAFGDSCEWFSDPWGPLMSGTESGWCNSMMGGSKGCWDNFNEESCDASSDMGMPCQWKNDSYSLSGGWCEQKGCWNYDGNKIDCENITLTVLNCSYDTNNDYCYENFGVGCGEFNEKEFDCYATGFCFWDPSDNSCNEPMFNDGFKFEEFFNPGCWIFNMSNGAEPCSNVTSCTWTGSNCNDDGAESNNGIQCYDINNSEMCNSIPMLSTCCAWNGTGCASAPSTKACWDNMQEPPTGAMFCEDFNAIHNQTNCELIASDPWYMPCEWDIGASECKFAFDELFGGPMMNKGFEDIGSKQNCEAAGGIWKSETWKDNIGIVYNDEWCEMGFGIGYETCDSSCWACEFDENGDNWANGTAARNACEASGAFDSSCVFHNDSHAFNGYGWCDVNMSGFDNLIDYDEFKFEDCNGLIDSDGDGLLPKKDPDCAGFMKFGFINIEKGTDCGDLIDNDGNGLVDCDDPGCVYESYYCDQSDINDTTRPKTTWFEVNTYPDGAFIAIDTNEPTNGSVLFYKTDSSCTTLNLTILDWKLENSFIGDDFDVWHDIPVDIYTLNYSLDLNTSYYYKTELCDQSGNCITSACSNFTTEINETGFSVSFDLPSPQDDVTEYLGFVQVSFDLDADGVFDDSVINSAHGLQFNASMGRDVDIKFSNPNSTKEWGIYFIGADLLKVVSMNITDAFVISESAEGDVFLGMKKDNWKELAQGLGVDYVRIVMPQILNEISTGKIKHCPDNASDVDDVNCVELDLDDINCTFGLTSTTCEIPINIGFSVFVVEDAYVAPVTEGSSSGGGGGGGGGGGAAVDISQTPVMKSYAKGGKYVFSYGGASHSVTVNSIDGDSVNITIASVPTIFTLKAGEVAKKDLDEDGDYDIKVEVLSIDTIVSFSIAGISEKVVSAGTEGVGQESEKEPKEEAGAESGTGVIAEATRGAIGGVSNNLLWIIVGVVIVGVVAFYKKIFSFVKKK